MSVIAETIEILKERAPSPFDEIWIEDLVIGIFFTGVKLSTGYGGCAFTPAGEIPEAVCCPTSAARMPAAGHFVGKKVSEIINFSLDPNVLKSAIGIATLNALSHWVIESGNQKESVPIKDRDGYDLLNIQPHETVSLVGAFHPYIRRLKSAGNPFYIIEKNRHALRPDEMKHFRPESEMKTAIANSQVILLTGTTIVNQTVDHILSWINNGKRTAIVGPTASLIPDAFYKRGVTVMAGIHIFNPDRMLEILKQGVSAYHLLRESAQKIAFVNRPL